MPGRGTGEPEEYRGYARTTSNVSHRKPFRVHGVLVSCDLQNRGSSHLSSLSLSPSLPSPIFRPPVVIVPPIPSPSRSPSPSSRNLGSRGINHWPTKLSRHHTGQGHPQGYLVTGDRGLLPSRSYRRSPAASRQKDSPVAIKMRRWHACTQNVIEGGVVI